MIRKLTFLVGLGTGYVLGAKAGEQRYTQIMDKAREIAGLPAVQEATSTLQDVAASAASTVGDKAASAASTVSDKAKNTLGGTESTPSTVDLNGTKAPVTTSKAPLSGTTPSGSIPVVKTP